MVSKISSKKKKKSIFLGSCRGHDNMADKRRRRRSPGFIRGNEITQRRRKITLGWPIDMSLDGPSVKITGRASVNSGLLG